MNLKTGVWYKIEEEDYNPYDFVLFLYLIKKEASNWQVLSAWSNTNNPKLQLYIDSKSDSFFAERKTILEITPNIENLKNKMIELVFKEK
jgi:hypothetical protein